MKKEITFSLFFALLLTPLSWMLAAADQADTAQTPTPLAQMTPRGSSRTPMPPREELEQTEPPSDAPDDTHCLCPKENRWAILIVAGGNDSEREKGNMERLREGLVVAGLDPKHILVMEETAKEPLLQPTRENVLAHLEWIQNKTRQGPLPIQTKVNVVGDEPCEVWLFIALAGATESDSMRPVLSTIPTPSGEGDGVLLDELRERIDESGVERIMVFFNLRSASSARGSWANSRNSPIRLRSMMIKRQRSHAELEYQRDIFHQPESKTSFLSMFCDGLTGIADRHVIGNGDGFISANEMIAYLEYHANRQEVDSFQLLFKGNDFPLAQIKPQKKTSGQIEKHDAMTSMQNGLNILLLGKPNSATDQTAKEIGAELKNRSRL